jgi:hypothetical protein
LSAVAYTWRDAELRALPLRALNGVGARFERLGRFGRSIPSLKPASIAAAAAKSAGSDDFGSDSFREPL